MPRVAVDYRTASNEVYRAFCREHPDVHLTVDQWRDIIYTYNYSFRDYILETGNKARLPWGFGYFTISGKTPVREGTNKIDGKKHIVLPVDWKATKELGKMIYHLNRHTDGKRFKWFWFSNEAVIYQPDIWNFKPTRTSSRKIKEVIEENPLHSQVYKQWSRR